MGRRYRKEIDSSRKLLQLLSLSLSVSLSISISGFFFVCLKGEKKEREISRTRKKEREVGNKSWDEKRRGKVRKRAAWRRLHAAAPPPIPFWFYLFGKFVCVPQCVSVCTSLWVCQCVRYGSLFFFVFFFWKKYWNFILCIDVNV